MKLNLLVIATLAVSLLAACNLGKAPEPTADVNAIFTGAAQTVAAQFSAQQTQTAQAIPLASPTALATPTFLPTFPTASNTTPFATLGSQNGALTPFPTSVGGGTGGGSKASGCSVWASSA